MYKLSENTFNEKEINSVIKLISSSKPLSYSKNVLKLEKKIAKLHQRKYAIMVNSGSSANLLGIAALIYDNQFKLKKGDEVIVPAISWSTTYTPLIQLGLKLVFVDVEKETFNLDPNLVEKAISKKTKAIFCVNILGLCCNYSKLQKIALKNKLYIFEDNCESLGAKYNNIPSGKFGIFSSLSSYYSHHICTIEGGFLLTDNFRLYCNALSIRSHGWLREQPANSHIKSKKFSDFEKKFKFFLPGFNLRPTEINAVLGLEQLKKLNSFLKYRKENAKVVYDIFSKSKNSYMQKYDDHSSFFGFSFILKNNLLNNRKKIINFLDANKIECRPIVSGNILNNPMLNFASYRKYGNFKNVINIDQNGFMIGNRSRPYTNIEIKALKKLNKFINNI